MKRSAEEIRTENKNIEFLLKACYTSTVVVVDVALQKVGTPNVVATKELVTPLIFACSNPNWTAAKAIVSFLLAHGASVHQTDHEGNTALHYAVSRSSCEVVQILVDEGHHPIDPRGKDDRTPLRAVVLRSDQKEAVKIARLLVARGADLCDKVRGWTPLMIACNTGVSMEMVVALSPKNHPCINYCKEDASDNKKWSALLCAASNPYHGTQSFPHLMDMGADPLVLSSGNTATIVNAAYNCNGYMMKCVGLYLNADQITTLSTYVLPGRHCADVLGVIRAARHIHGKSQRKHAFSLAVATKIPKEHLWALLRAGPPCFDGSEDDYFRVLREKGAPHVVWREVNQLAAAGMHPITGDTLLHNAVRTKDLSTVIFMLTTQKPCPFFCNASNETPMSLAQTLRWAEAVDALVEYSAWRPTPMHMDWYGPFFRMRARTFLLVCKRLRVFPKDVIFLILGRVAAMEEV